MKLKLTIGVLLSALLIGMTACKTSSTGVKQIDPDAADKLAPILSGSVAGAVVYAYNKNTNTEVYAETIKTALNEFLLQTNLSPVHLQTTLYNLPIKELKTAEAQLIISPLLATYQGFFDRQVKDKVAQDAGLVILLKAIVDGLDQGLTAIDQIKASNTKPSASISDMDALGVMVAAMTTRMQIEGAAYEAQVSGRWSQKETALFRTLDTMSESVGRASAEGRLR